MFRDLYKKANDDIKGDRTILDKAFLQAAVPVKKKSPVIKYSFIGTAVAAVVVLGAVFANPSVFTKRSEDLGKYTSVTPTENVEVETTAKAVDIPAVVEVDATVENDVPAYVSEQVENTDAPKVNTVAPKKETVSRVVENTVSDDVAAAANDDAVEDVVDDYGIATMSLENGDEEVWEQPTEEAAVGFTLRDTNVLEEDEKEWVEDEVGTQTAGGSDGVTEAATETATEAETTEAVEMFSYMYDKSVHTEGMAGVKTEGFVNTDISPVANSTEAIERAKAECTVEYDTADVYNDPIESMWKVHFREILTEGGDQCVYMNSDGVTQMIVYGE